MPATTVRNRGPAPSVPTETLLEAVIVGAGPSGIASACRLKLDLGLKYIRIFEKGLQFGGTWYWNTYPGAACNIPPRLYSFSFHQKKTWDSFFTTREEMASYLQEVAIKYELDDHWVVKYRTSYEDPRSRRYTAFQEGVTTAKVLINCSGALSVPRECDVEGWRDFQGELFHTARWRRRVKLEGKNVVVLGNGCSATQIVPSIAEEVKSVTQIVRAKHWYTMAPDNPMEGRFFNWMEENFLGFPGLERFILALVLDASFIQAWNQSGKGARDRFAKNSINYIKNVAPEKYHHLLIPEEKELEVACKRRIFDQGYVDCLNRPNVHLTNDPAVKIDADSVILKSGKVLLADIIVLASGFQTAETCLQMKVYGVDGEELNDRWVDQGGPQAYRSAMCHGFPNFFLVWGLNTATGHFSAIWSIEATAQFMTTVLKPIFKSGTRFQDPFSSSSGKQVSATREAEEKEQAMIQHEMKNLIYTSGCKGWYTSSSGKVSTLYTGFQLAFLWRSRNPVANDLIYSGVSRLPITQYWTWWQRFSSYWRVGDIPEYRASHQRHTPLYYVFRPFALMLASIGTMTLVAMSYVTDTVLFKARVPQRSSQSRPGSARELQTR